MSRGVQRVAVGLWGGAVLLWVCGEGMTAEGGRAERVPSTCQAVFVGPTRHCSWGDTFSAAGTSSSPEKAGTLAAARLLAGISGLAEARALQTAGTLAAARAEPERQACPAAASENLRLSCFPDLRLEQTLTCFGDFPDGVCWEPHMVILEGVGWKTMEKVREQLCEEVEVGLRRGELSPAEQARCVARCQLEGQVRCPGLASAP